MEMVANLETGFSIYGTFSAQGKYQNVGKPGFRREPEHQPRESILRRGPTHASFSKNVGTVIAIRSQQALPSDLVQGPER
jgi:hypothetical protein